MKGEGQPFLTMQDFFSASCISSQMLFTDSLATLQVPVVTADASKNYFWAMVETFFVIFCYEVLSDAVLLIEDKWMNCSVAEVKIPTVS